MHYLPGYTDVFMSPVTGELASHRQIPPAEYGEILVADQSGYFSPSLALIDAKIDINSLKKLTNGLNEASVILQKHPDQEFFPYSQVLDDLVNGFLLKEDGGVLSTVSTIPPEKLELPYGQLFIGNSDNIASPSQIISLDNLPNLGEAVVDGISLPAGKIWRGTSSNRPEESNAVSIIEADILAINARFLLGNFIMGDALIQYTFPNSQFLINLQDGMLKKTGKTLQHAVAGEDYLQELPNLTADMVWRGDPTNRPVEAPYVSEERLQELVEQAEAAVEEAEAAAEEATGAAEEATGAAAEATGAAAEASASALEASVSAGLAAASAAAAAGSAVSAASDASDAEGYKNEAHDYLKQTQTYYNNLTTTGLNALPCSGDVSLNGFKIINMAPPVNDNDGVNKKYYDDGYAVLQNEIDNIEPGATSITLQGDITASGPLNAPVSTTFNKTLNTISNTGNVSLSGYKLINVGTPVDATDGVTKQYCDQKVATTISSTNITLQGDVSGSGSLSSSISTTFNKTLNNIVNAGNVSLANYKLIGLGAPSDPYDGANKQYCDQKISSTNITLQGDITGTGALSSNISTTFNKTLNTINTTGNIDVKNFNIVNLKDPQGPQHAATQNWVQSYVNNTITNPVSGNFTPTLCDVNKNDIIGNPAYGGQGYDMQMGRYLKVGPMVFIEMHIICGGGSYGNDQTQMYFVGLPFNITYSNLFYLPINYVNCDANNILRLYVTVSPTSSPDALTCIYQSPDQSLNNVPKILKRGAINRYNNKTYFCANFSYTTNS